MSEKTEMFRRAGSALICMCHSAIFFDRDPEILKGHKAFEEVEVYRCLKCGTPYFHKHLAESCYECAKEITRK